MLEQVVGVTQEKSMVTMFVGHIIIDQYLTRPDISKCPVVLVGGSDLACSPWNGGKLVTGNFGRGYQPSAEIGPNRERLVPWSVFISLASVECQVSTST